MRLHFKKNADKLAFDMPTTAELALSPNNVIALTPRDGLKEHVFFITKNQIYALGIAAEGVCSQCTATQIPVTHVGPDADAMDSISAENLPACTRVYPINIKESNNGAKNKPVQYPVQYDEKYNGLNIVTKEGQDLNILPCQLGSLALAAIRI